MGGKDKNSDSNQRAVVRRLESGHCHRGNKRENEHHERDQEVGGQQQDELSLQVDRTARVVSRVRFQRPQNVNNNNQVDDLGGQNQAPASRLEVSQERAVAAGEDARGVHVDRRVVGIPRVHDRLVFLQIFRSFRPAFFTHFLRCNGRKGGPSESPGQSKDERVSGESARPLDELLFQRAVLMDGEEAVQKAHILRE